MPVTPVEVTRADGPLILGIPHAGTHVPDDIADRLDDNGRLLADTDWHVDRLYAGLVEATVIRATFHRYVIDANRPPDDGTLYPGQNTTGLVPLTDFDGRPLWRPGAEPTAEDRATRLAAYHAPYHAALAAEVERVRAANGVAVLYDCHSIRSVCPFLFDGRLPDLNIGDNGGTTCAAAVTEAASEVAAASGYTHVVNGRFKGGWTTRHYGRPGAGVHAIQMELAQATHLASEAPPFAYDPARADQLRRTLGLILARLERLALSGALA
jgi:formiminoglutamase